MHVFVVPELDGPVTGGTLFNRMLIASLQRTHGRCKACSRAAARDELLGAGPDDVVWVDSLFLDLLPELARRRRGRVRLGLLAHYLPSWVRRGDALTGRELTRVEAAALASADLVLVPSPTMRTVVERVVASPPPVLVVEPGRLSRGPVECCDPPVRAALVANLVPGKGVLPFLCSLAAQVRASDRYQLDIVGGAGLDPAYARRCQRAAEDPGLQGRVHLLGERLPEATVRHLANCNLLVSASTMESYGMALAEARCLGLPIVAVRGGNVQALVSATAGGEVVRDGSALARAFLAVCRDPADLRRRMAAAQASPLPPRPWTTVAAEFLDQMKSLRTHRPGAATRSPHVEPR
jgi:glycosyltransferase involved in cell wall biosynthesis